MTTHSGGDQHDADDMPLARRALLAAISRRGLTLTGLPEPLFPHRRDGDRAEGFTTTLSFVTGGRRAVSIVVDGDIHVVVVGTVIVLPSIATPTGWPHRRDELIVSPRSFRVDDVEFVLHQRRQLLAVTVIALDRVADPVIAIGEGLDRLVAVTDRVVRDLERVRHDWLPRRPSRWPWQRRFAERTDPPAAVPVTATHEGGDATTT